ncbi:MAG: hypothetical protein RLN70_11015, partial [Rhodospirillaceae bacterium]
MSDVPAQRLAGAILITDGQVHDALSLAKAEQVQAPYLNAPLHGLITGNRQEYDRRIRIERAPDFGLVDKPAMVQLNLEDTAAPTGTPIRVTITRNDGTPQTLTLPAGEPTEVPLPIENAGANVFEVEVEEGTGELSTANNRTLIN